MKRRVSFVIVFWWLTLLMTLGGFLLCFTDHDPVASDTENRMLQGFPALSVESLKSGAFMSEFESYLSDRMPERDGIIAATNAMLDAFSALEADDYLAADMGAALDAQMDGLSEPAADAAEEPEPDAPAVIESVPAETGAEPAKTAAPDAADSGGTAPEADANVGGGAFGMWFLRTDGRYENIYYYTALELRRLALTLNDYAELVGEDGQVVFAHIPSANLVNRWANGGFVGMVSNAENEIRKSTGERVTVLNAIELLTPHIEAGEYLFFRTDHHWTALGAYYLHKAFLEAQGLPALAYDDYRYTRVEDYLGSVYDSSPTAAVRAQADSIEVPELLTPTRLFTVRLLEDETEYPLIDLARSGYRIFVGSSKGPAWRIDTGAHTGRKLLVISDSFGNALVPYLTPYYDEVHLINLRPDMYTPVREGATIREYIEHYGIHDVFVVPSTFTGVGTDCMTDYLGGYIDGK